MQAATIVLAVAAIGGLAVAALRLTGMPRPPTWIAIGHGIIAATGLGILAYTASTEGVPAMAQASLAVLAAAAVGGVTMFVGWHLRERPLPIPFVLGHGLLAIVGYALLVLTLYRGH